MPSQLHWDVGMCLDVVVAVPWELWGTWKGGTWELPGPRAAGTWKCHAALEPNRMSTHTL